MGSNARAERRRSARAKAKASRRQGHEYAEHGVQLAWCADDPDAIEEAKKSSHDALIAGMGDERRGGVVWQLARGDAARKIMGDMFDGASPVEADYYRRIVAHLREYGGVLVVAHAPGRRPGVH